MNLVVLSGRLTKDGELRTNEGGTSFYHNSIAVQRSYKNIDGTYDADFFNFTLINPGENLVKYLTKGKSVLIRGEIKNRSYDAQDGTKKYATEIMVMRIELIGGSKQDNKENEPQEEVEVPQNTKSDYDNENTSVQLNDNDLPF